MTAAEERRLARRITFKNAVRYQLKDPSQFGGTVAYDLSETGLRLRLMDFLPVGTEVTVDIKLTSGRVVECRGHVMWVSQIPYTDQYQAGVAFVHPEIIMDEKQQIREMVAAAV